MCGAGNLLTCPCLASSPAPSQYPEVLGSILGALKGVVNVIGMSRMTPPIKELLPRLTPILKNRCGGALQQLAEVQLCNMLMYSSAVSTFCRLHI